VPAAGRLAVQLGCRQQRPRYDWLLLRLFISKSTEPDLHYWWKTAISNK